MSFGYQMLGFGSTAAAAAAPAYDPLAMTFDGSTGYYNKTGLTFSGNKVTCIARMKLNSFTGNKLVLANDTLVSGGSRRVLFYIGSSDYSTADYRNKLLAVTQNSGASNICFLISINDIADGQEHTVFYSFDGDTGSATFFMDGLDADDTGNASRTAPTTGTLGTASATQAWGAVYNGSVNHYAGELSYLGYDDQYLTNPTDFYHPTNGLQELDTTTWTEWGSQPQVFSPDGKLDTNNLGSLGAFTKNGTITGPA